MNEADGQPAGNTDKGRKRLHFRAVKGDQGHETVGAELRAARLKKGDELEAVAVKLKIRKEVLQALEESDYERHPPKVYAIGFVRAYSVYLGLDANQMVKRYKSEIAGRTSDKTPQLNFPETPEENNLPIITLFLLAIVLGLIGYGAWTLSQEASAVPEVQVVTEEEAKRIAEAEAAAKVPPALGLPADPLLFAQQMAAPEQAPAKVYGDTVGITRISLRATEDCYVRIRDIWSDGGPKVIFEQTLMKGESYRVPNRGGLQLRAGNAGALIVEIDGKELGALGKPGDTADRVSLMAERLIARFDAGEAPQQQTRNRAEDPRDLPAAMPTQSAIAPATPPGGPGAVPIPDRSRN
jgi:cytoskeleton protein RodZ